MIPCRDHADNMFTVPLNFFLLLFFSSLLFLHEKRFDFDENEIPFSVLWRLVETLKALKPYGFTSLSVLCPFKKRIPIPLIYMYIRNYLTVI